MEPTTVLQLSVITPEDIAQEAELLKLLGVANPNKSIIAKRLATRELFFGEGELSNAQPLTSPRPQAPDHVLEALVDYALENEAHTAAIMAFLDSPEDMINETLELLGLAEKKIKTTSLSSILENALPATLPELYSLARSIIQTERPEATVRQWYRRGTRNGHLTLVEDQVRKVS